MEIFFESILEIFIEGIFAIVYYLFNKFFKHKVSEKIAKIVSGVLSGILIIGAFIIIFMIISGCESSESKDTVGNISSIENSMIIQVNEKDLVKVSEDEVLEYFNEKKNDFIALADYLLANERGFGTRPVIISKD